MSVVHRSDDLPAHSRLEYIRHVLSMRVVPMEFRPAAGADFRAHILTGDVGVLQVTQVASSAGSCVRTPKQVRRVDPDLYTVAAVTHGHMTTERGGCQASRVGPGDFFLEHSSHPFWHVHPAIQLVTVSFPRAMLPLPPHQVAGLSGVPFAGGRGVSALVSTFVRRLPRHLDEADGPPGPGSARPWSTC